MTASAVYNLKNFFSQQTRDNIKIQTELPIFDVKRISGNNDSKTIIPLSLPITENKYVHTITIDHKATLNSNGMLISKRLYLKVTPKWDTKNTFSDPDRYFKMQYDVNGKPYDDSTKPNLVLNAKNIGELEINFKIEEVEALTFQGAELDLVCDYELVDSNGKSIEGGKTQITTSMGTKNQTVLTS